MTLDVSGYVQTWPWIPTDMSRHDPGCEQICPDMTLDTSRLNVTVKRIVHLLILSAALVQCNRIFALTNPPLLMDAAPAISMMSSKRLMLPEPVTLQAWLINGTSRSSYLHSPGISFKLLQATLTASLAHVVWVWLAITDAITKRIVTELVARSEERRVGKECRSRWSP